MFSSNTTQVSSGGYQISRSLRFNSADSAYLNRTPASATNRKTWTWSAWVKRSALLTTNVPQNLFGARNGGGSPSTLFRYDDGTTATANGLLFQDDNGATLRTTAQYRDVSAWYHIVLAVDTTQATASNRVRIYINGVEVTAFSTATYPSQNLDMAVNSTNDHRIGNQPVYGDQYNGYMTEINFIDGQQLTPSSFGETNAQTGVWQPKVYSGSYGTNGFYLNFSDNSNTTAATLGKDYSGNGNNWTPNNFSVTAGAGNDSLVDSPTSYGTDTGVGGTVRGNYAVLNPLKKKSVATISNGNLSLASTGATAYVTGLSTISPSSGYYYMEMTCVGSNTDRPWGIGFAETTAADTATISTASTYFVTNGSGSTVVYLVGATTVATLSTTTTWAAGDVISLAWDATSTTNKMWVGRNGVWYPSTTGGTVATNADVAAGNYPTFTISNAANTNPQLFPAFVTYGTAPTVDVNFGQRPFAYTAPSGYKALCTQNLPTPTIGATTATQAGKYFNPVLYTGNSVNGRAVTGVGFQPDMVWVKGRSTVSNHVLNDVLRGGSQTLFPNTNEAQYYDPDAFVKSFTSDGFTVGQLGGVNDNTATYVAWSWKANGAGVTNTAGSITSTVSANTTSGFSVVTYTGNGTQGATIGHGLGVAPKLMIAKRRNTTGNWPVYSSSLSAVGNVLYLNLTNAQSFNDTQFGGIAPTSTVLYVGNGSDTNASGSTYVAYCFAEVAGYSKFGSYTGNSSNDGPFVYCGFRPRYIMVKCTSESIGPGSGWHIIDTARSTYNTAIADLLANASFSEADIGTSYPFDINSNGFKLRTSNSYVNNSGQTYIFAAFAEAPFKYSLAR